MLSPITVLSKLPEMQKRILLKFQFKTKIYQFLTKFYPVFMKAQKIRHISGICVM